MGYFYCIFEGVEFGARMINIDGKQIKLQIWDTVSLYITLNFMYRIDINIQL